MPGSRVLLVDRDVDTLANLAAELRVRGIRVSLANGAQMACERAKTFEYDVVLASRSVAEPTDGGIGVIDALSVELAEVPPLLVIEEEGSSRKSSELRYFRHDVERIVSRVLELSKPGSRPPQSNAVPIAHSLDSSLGDLLEVLSTERRSGTVTVTTPVGAGEVRLVEGDIADAVYVRLEGKKAIARMHAERIGIATFTPGAPAIMRRIHEPTRAIVEEVRSLAARADDLRMDAAELVGIPLLALDGSSGELDETDRHVLARLRVPATLDEILDELPEPDASLLESILRLDKCGRIKRLGGISERAQLCGPDQIHLLRATVARARPSGFNGATRIVFAATPARLGVFGHTLVSLADIVPSEDPAPSIPIPFVMATLRLGDGIDLDVVALPLVPAYAPLWPLTLAGAVVIVRLDEASVQLLEDACANLSISVIDAKATFGTVEETNALQVASLIRTALEASAVPSK